MALVSESARVTAHKRALEAKSTWHWLPALLAAALLVPISNGRCSVPAAAWLAPLFLLRYLRTQRPLRGLAIVYGLFLAAFPVQWSSIVPLEGVGYWLFALGFQLVYLMPFAIDRYLAPRIRGFASTLVFPVAWTSLEYVVCQFSPYTSWGSIAYTQFGNLPLLQLLSVTGLYGVTFLMCWFASVGSWAWGHASHLQDAYKGLMIYGAVLALVLVLGGIRLEVFPASDETVRVASLTVDPGAARRAWNVRRDGTKPRVLEAVRRDTRALHDALLERSAAEARAGARLVFWSELNALVLKDDEGALIERGRDLARREAIYLGMALGTITPGQWLMQNRLVVVDPAGELVASYYKARPVPGDPESGASDTIPIVATPFGKLALGICYDLDFPGLIRQAGQAHADLMIVPALDWASIDPGHTRMALFRAIENGFSLVRQTDHGLSAAADHQGRMLAAMDYFTTSDRVMRAHVPTHGVRTVYARIGDVFAWGCIVALCVFAVMPLLGARMRRRQFGRDHSPP
jgi:apolipoprotein N-acyltransferase